MPCKLDGWARPKGEPLTLHDEELSKINTLNKALPSTLCRVEQNQSLAN